MLRRLNHSFFFWKGSDHDKQWSKLWSCRTVDIFVWFLELEIVVIRESLSWKQTPAERLHIVLLCVGWCRNSWNFLKVVFSDFSAYGNKSSSIVIVVSVLWYDFFYPPQIVWTFPSPSFFILAQLGFFFFFLSKQELWFLKYILKIYLSLTKKTNLYSLMLCTTDNREIC